MAEISVCRHNTQKRLDRSGNTSKSDSEAVSLLETSISLHSALTLSYFTCGFEHTPVSFTTCLTVSQCCDLQEAVSKYFWPFCVFIKQLINLSYHIKLHVYMLCIFVSSEFFAWHVVGQQITKLTVQIDPWFWAMETRSFFRSGLGLKSF